MAISGAGPSLLALCDGGHTAVAAAMRDTWAAHQVAAEVLTLELQAVGATAVVR